MKHAFSQNARRYVVPKHRQDVSGTVSTPNKIHNIVALVEQHAQRTEAVSMANVNVLKACSCVEMNVFCYKAIQITAAHVVKHANRVNPALRVIVSQNSALQSHQTSVMEVVFISHTIDSTVALVEAVAPNNKFARNPRVFARRD